MDSKNYNSWFNNQIINRKDIYNNRYSGNYIGQSAYSTYIAYQCNIVQLICLRLHIILYIIYLHFMR